MKLRTLKVLYDASGGIITDVLQVWGEGFKKWVDVPIIVVTLEDLKETNNKLGDDFLEVEE